MNKRWHYYAPYNGHALAFGYIGVPPAYCTGCSANKGEVSPNNSPMVDALVDTLAHEIVEGKIVLEGLLIKLISRTYTSV